MDILKCYYNLQLYGDPPFASIKQDQEKCDKALRQYLVYLSSIHNALEQRVIIIMKFCELEFFLACIILLPTVLY